MLQFVSMTIDNFGPYKGANAIDFTDQKGVSIFWGDNGRGKTVLLNAFRFALFGTIQRRHGSLRSLREMENYENRSFGQYGFSISIHMKNEDDNYELTRAYQLRQEVTTPKSDTDYEKKIFLKMNGSILSPQDRDHVLNNLMPEQVSRFFLFDGELLQEYEELVIDEANSGDRIKEAIEKILGVPVLQNGAVDLENIKFEHEQITTKIAQKDAKTKKLAVQLSGVEEEIAEHTRLINEMRQKVDNLLNDKRGIEAELKNTEKIRNWISKKEAKKAEIQRQDKREVDLLQQISEITKVCWRGMLADRINDSIRELMVSISGLEKKKTTRFVADKFIEEMKTACHNKKCPVCTQDISDDILHYLQAQISTSESRFAGLSPEEEEVLLSLQAQVATLKRLSVTDKKQALSIYESELASLRINKGQLTQEIAILSKHITTYEEENDGVSEIGTLTQKFAQLESKIQNLNIAMGDERKKRDDAVKQRTKILEQINKAAVGGELFTASKKQQLCEDIFAIFSEGIETYSKRLKKNVERDATRLFTQIANDKEYIGLRINDNYGLNIFLSDGTVVPGRSAGYEHIVALSLIGALHKNAPLQGPIIMDSPFGRLDPTHKKNIVSVLPDMANQVILLVYTDEIDEQLTRESLGNYLLSEHRLTRVSSMHTKIE
jgi:DNA sulfur modification protein DndD